MALSSLGQQPTFQTNPNKCQLPGVKETFPKLDIQGYPPCNLIKMGYKWLIKGRICLARKRP
jgi:hypothetical protein